MTSDRILWGALGAFVFSLLLSLALYLFIPGALTRTILLFPHELSRTLVPEARSLPFQWDREHNVELLVREVLLGPARHDHLRLFSRNAAVSRVLVRGSKIYIDLSKRSFLPDPDVLYSASVALDVLKTIVRDNFGGVSDVIITVGGEPVAVNHVDKG